MQGMEFHEKLQELRKRKGLTQEELAQSLYVSRTAISKWESGRGYPNIGSLRDIAAFFAVTVDQLLSTDEVLTVAEEDRRQKETRDRALVYGLLDLGMALLLFLPFFTARAEAVSASLLALEGVRWYMRAAYFAVVLGTSAVGVLMLAAPHVWASLTYKASLVLGTVAVLLFTVGTQPYAAVFAFALLIIKALLLFKRT